MGTLASANWGLFPGYTVIGITLGGIYALAAIGLVLIYRVSGVLNFAQGAVSMFSAFIAYQVSTVMGYPAAVGLLAAIVAGGAIGYLIERFTIRPLAGRSALSKVVVTIGWLLVLQTAAGLIWGQTAYHRPVQLASIQGFTFPGTSVVVGWDEFTTIVVALGLAEWILAGIVIRTRSSGAGGFLPLSRLRVFGSFLLFGGSKSVVRNRYDDRYRNYQSCS